MTHRVLLVREWDAQTSGSGCCGRLGGEQSDLGDPATYAHTRATMEAMGRVYRALADRLGDRVGTDVELTVVDPRNAVWLVPSLARDARRRGLGVRDVLTQVRDGVADGAVVVDGLVLYSGRVPEPDEAVDAVLGALVPA
jgi:hypothetical protein